ncbi:MAG: type II secretion system protein [Desulfuromusa sp.]|nr:type II secretion system protein [Desulfuromusa sp.]
MLQRSCFESSGLNNQRGAVLLMVLVSVTLLGLLAGIAGSSWQTIVQRAKEADLLWKGDQIRQAIGSYYNASQSKGTIPRVLPPTLDHLILDSRFLETKRHLRSLYPDPMTGIDWVVIKGPSGRVMGVRSSSDKVPFKQDGFSEANRSFSGQQSYKNWQFIYQPKQSTLPKKIATQG